MRNPSALGTSRNCPSAQAPITSCPRLRISRISGNRKCCNEKSTLVISIIFMAPGYTGCDALRHRVSRPVRSRYRAGTGSARRANPPGGREHMLVSYWRGILLSAVLLAVAAGSGRAQTSFLDVGKQVPITILINSSPWLGGFQSVAGLYEQQTGNKISLDVTPY